MSEPKFPDIHVVLTGLDGNAMSIMAAVTKGLKLTGHRDQVVDFMNEAMSGDYNHVIQTAMKWVSVS